MTASELRAELPFLLLGSIVGHAGRGPIPLVSSAIRRHPPLVQYPPDLWGLVRSGGLPEDLFGCSDLLKKEAWYDHEVNLAASGIRAYRAIPLVVRGELIGLAVFCRRDPKPFTPDQLETLTSVAPPIGVAVSNALDNERIRELRDQIEGSQRWEPSGSVSRAPARSKRIPALRR